MLADPGQMRSIATRQRFDQEEQRDGNRRDVISSFVMSTGQRTLLVPSGLVGPSK